MPDYLAPGAFVDEAHEPTADATGQPLDAAEIGRSIERALQWTVFEPNADPLWARVVRTVDDLMTGEWKAGALAGRTPAEAWFVRCGRSTMTQADVDNGRLIVEIGFAPVNPAEFVVVRLGLMTATGGD